MADEQPTPDKGLPPGVNASDLDEGQQRTAGAPAAPEVRNTPPEPTAEEKAKIAEAEAAQAAQKEEDEKKAKEAEQKDQTDQNNDGDEPLKEFPVYNDEAADAVVGLLKEAGVTPLEADAWFREAVITGDLTKIDLAKMSEKVGKAKADLIMMGVRDYYTRQTEHTTAGIKAVHDAVGGEANWNKIIKWAHSKYDSDKEFAKKADTFNKMFDLDATSAALAGRELLALYEADAGNSSLGTKIVHGDGTGSEGLGSEPLSRRDYVEKLKVAHAKNDFHEVDRLNQQRKATLLRQSR